MTEVTPASSTVVLSQETKRLGLQKIRQETLEQNGAAQLDPVNWHYIQVLTQRAQRQQGLAQHLLLDKLEKALSDLQAKLSAAPKNALQKKQVLAPSPLAALLQEMLPKVTDSDAAQNTSGQVTKFSSTAWRAESPRIRQFRKQLQQISVQKQVSNAIAQAPQNAGPINSHMLILKSLSVMRDASPDYLNRFMGYVDTLLWLEVAESVKPAVGKKNTQKFKPAKSKL